MKTIFPFSKQQWWLWFKNKTKYKSTKQVFFLLEKKLRSYSVIYFQASFFFISGWTVVSYVCFEQEYILVHKT